MDLDWLEDYNKHRDAVTRVSGDTSSNEFRNAIYEASKWFNSLKPAQKGDVFLFMAGALWEN